MSKYLERTNASKPTFGDYVTLEMKCYGVPNEYFIHEVLSSPFISNSWREVPIKAGYFEEQLHDTIETVIAVRTQGINSRDAQIFAVRLADVLPMKGTNWSWRESPLRSRIAELEAENETIISDYEERMDNLVNIGNETGRLLQAEIGYLNAQLAIKKLTTETLQLRIAELEYQLEDWTNNGWAEDYKARIAELEAAQRWIPVSERLPQIGVRVLFYNNFMKNIHKGWYSVDEWVSESRVFYDGDKLKRITHWMPLPSAPESEDE